jgi:non-specific serine/threonine protein kinase
MLAVLAGAKGDFARSVEYAVEGRIAAIASGVLWLQCPCLESLAYYHAWELGDYDTAIRLTEESLELFHRTGDKWGIAMNLNDLAFFRALAGQYAQAESACAEGILLVEELADRFLTAYFLVTLAVSQAAQGYGARAVQLWGGMEGLLESVGSPVQDPYKPLVFDRRIEPLKEVLGESAFSAALSEGRAMSFTQAIRYALAATGYSPGTCNGQPE